MVLKCEKCSHKEVCSYKKQMLNLHEELTDKMKLMENKNFRLELHCNFFIQEGVTLK